jgi:osmotically-inducible protein OsmY
MILYALDQPEFKDTPEKTKAIRNLVLSSQVKAKLALDQRTKGLELDAEAEDGKVLVKGQLFTAVTPSVTGTQRTRAYITEIAKDIPGVKELIVDLK